MVKSAPEARDAYEKGIKRVGAEAYKQASRASTPKEAADILQKAAGTGEALSIRSMSEKYEEKYA